MSNMYDYSDAEPPSFDLIPAGVSACVTVAVQAGDDGTPENAFKQTESGLLMLQLEFTVTETEDGKYVGRKFWQNLNLGAARGTQLSEGQEKSINIAKGLMRSILEAGRGYAPTDESEAAINARKVDSIHELDGLEFWCEIGVEKSKDPRYDDKNKIKKIHAVAGSDEVERVASKTAPKTARVAAPKAAPNGAARPAPTAGKPAGGSRPTKPNWG